MNTQAIQNEIDRIANDAKMVIAERYLRGWKTNRSVTKKSINELESLGLSAYDIPHGDYQEVVDAVIREAKDAGGKVTTHTNWSGGDADVATTVSKPSVLYTLLNTPDPEPEPEVKPEAQTDTVYKPYKVGDRVRFANPPIWSGTRDNGVLMGIWKTGVVIGEGIYDLNHPYPSQRDIIVKPDDGGANYIGWEGQYMDNLSRPPVMTAAEVEAAFSLQPGTVRQYLGRHTEVGRKADGRTWLVSRWDAERIWG